MSHQQHSEAEKLALINRYRNGESVQKITAETGIPRSTLYFWIERHRSLKSSVSDTVSYKEYYTLKRHTQKLEEQLAVLHAAGCGSDAPLQVKLKALEALHGQYSVHVLCDALNVSRGTFYNHIFRKKDVTLNEKRRAELCVQIREIFDDSKQRFGTERIRAILAERGIRTSREYVSGIMHEMGLECIGTRAKKDYKKQLSLTKKQNILQRQFNTESPNQVWVSDVTCIKVCEKYFYICVIIDLFSRKVVAYRVSLQNSTYLITSTFKQAFELRGKPQGLIFHSDQGSQYTSNSFCKLLHMNKVVQSFSNAGRPHDNAVAEAFFSSMKKEELYRNNYKSERELCDSVDEYIRFYNQNRPHTSLSFKTPDNLEAQYYSKNQF